MNHSEQCPSESRRQHNEAIVARHLHRLFARVPMLAGFWLHSDLTVIEVVLTPTGLTAGPDLYEQVAESLLMVAEECAEAVQLMRGRTFARAVH